jgi:hypothetical protein
VWKRKVFNGGIRWPRSCKHGWGDLYAALETEFAFLSLCDGLVARLLIFRFHSDRSTSCTESSKRKRGLARMAGHCGGMCGCRAIAAASAAAKAMVDD